MEYPHLHVRLLGEFCLVKGDTPVTTLNTPRLQALLAYLLLHRSAPQARRQLAFRFWPDSSEKQARTNLRHQFHLLRQALPLVDEFVQTDAHMLTWRGDAAVRLDVSEFESVVRQSHSIMALQEAIDLYQGDVLPDCYDDWILPIRERLRQTFIATLERLIGLLEQEHDYATAIRYAQRLQQCDPLHEATYRHLMRLYALQGDQASVQRTYAECVRCLQRELDAPPTTATSQAYEHLVKVNTPLVHRHNLASPLNPLVGRSAELTQIATLLADPACRLVTVVGAGGMGKSRLALQVAWGQIGHYLHGVYGVALHSIAAPDFLVSTIADALGFSFHGAQDPKVQLLNYLHEKEMLLLLDNFEHLLGGAGLLIEILTHAPAVKLLVTSRERLKLAGEWLYEIHGLAVPGHAEAAQMEGYAAVQLFTQHAKRVQVDFALSQATKPAVVRLCQLVEGMPLALEMAAAWARLLSCAEIVEELTQSLDLLTTASPNGLERHRSMRVVFDHSWHLLAPEEQQVFRRLAVFQGGFRREAAKQVAGASLSLLAALVDKSLVRWNRRGRYELHELTRQYAVEKLAEVPTEKEMTQNRHCRYYLEFLCQQEEPLNSSQQQQTMAEIRGEIDNVRLAWQRAMTQKCAREMGQAAQTLLEFYDIQGWLHEGEMMSRQAVEALASKGKVTFLGSFAYEIENLKEGDRERGIGLGQVLAQQGGFLFRLGQIGKAQVLFQQSVTLLRRLGARVELGGVLPFFSMVAWAEGNYGEAQTILQEGLTIYREQNSSWGMALCLGVMGNVAAALGNYGEAKHLLQQALALFKKVGDPRSTALALSYLSPIAYTLGDYSQSKQYIQESLTLNREIADRWSMILCLNHLGAITYLESAANWPEAKRLHEESLTIAKELGDRREIAVSLNHLGYVTYTLEQNSEAQQHFLSALQLSIEGQATPIALAALVGLATLLCQQPGVESEPSPTKGKERAAELLVLVLHHPAAAQETKDKARSLWNELAATLSPAQLVAAQERGCGRTLEEVATKLLAPSR